MLEYLEPLVLIKTVGLIGIIAVIFAESGLFFGFFLPGDSLLFTAGFLASQDVFNVWVLFIGCSIAAIAGDSIGYYFGKRVGPKIFKREDSWFFNKKHIDRSRAFYEEHGAKAIVLARFMPVIRTFAPILAGVGNMDYKKFVTFNIMGGLLWTTLLIWLGYFMGNAIPNVDAYLLPIIGGIVLISSLPVIYELAVDRKKA